MNILHIQYTHPCTPHPYHHRPSIQSPHLGTRMVLLKIHTDIGASHCVHTLDINLNSHIVPTSSMVCVSCLFRSASARNSCNGTLRLWAWISAHRHTYRGQHWGSYMHGGTFSASPVPRQQGVGRDPIVPGYETSESGAPLKGNLGERIEVWGVSLKRRSTC